MKYVLDVRWLEASAANWTVAMGPRSSMTPPQGFQSRVQGRTSAQRGAARRQSSACNDMLTLPARKLQQFSQEFYLLNLSATDVERLVRFEVLGQAGVDGRVETSEKAYQRPILKKKSDELAHHYLQCRDDGALDSRGMPWQARLAAASEREDRLIRIPTGFGKTAGVAHEARSSTSGSTSSRAVAVTATLAAEVYELTSLWQAPFLASFAAMP